MGTINGLNRFDGLSFTAYHSNREDSTSLTNNHITSLLEDKKGNLWIGTPDGLNLYNRNTNDFQRFIHSENNLNSLPHNYIHDILEDSNGKLWIATRGGLCRYDLKMNRFENFQTDATRKNGMRSNNVRCLYEDRNNAIWVGYFWPRWFAKI